MAVLILLKGLPGVGKTTLAKKLRDELKYEHIARDDIKEELIQSGHPESELGKRSYDILWAILEKRLLAGKSVISDTSLNQPIALKHIEQIAGKTRAQIVVLHCFCDVSVHKERLESRKSQGLASFWTDSWDKYQKYIRSEYNQGDFEIPHPTIRIDTGETINTNKLARQIKSVLAHPARQ